MKNTIALTFLLVALSLSAWSQEFKVAKNTGHLMINLPSVTVEGYSGNEIIFSTLNAAPKPDERAKGLRVISGSEFDDNTGLGLSVIEKDNIVQVNKASNQLNAKIKVMVPKGISISFSNNAVIGSDEVVFSNLSNEIEVTTTYNNIKLINNTGPMTVKTSYGEIEASFGANLKGPISIISIHGYVDVAIPSQTKANVDLSTSFGELLAAEGFKFNRDKTEDGMVSYREDRMKGTLNGGGTDIILKSNYGKIYLRESN